MKPIKKLRRKIAKLETEHRDTPATYLRLSLDYYILHGGVPDAKRALARAVEKCGATRIGN